MLSTPFETVTHIGSGIKESLMATCRLVIFLQQDRIYYLLVSPKGDVVLCKEFINIREISEEMFFRFVLEREKLLTEPFLECCVYVSYPKITLVPDEYWQPEMETPLARIMLDENLGDKNVYSSGGKVVPAKLIYAIQPSLIHLLDRYIRHYEVSHIAIPLLQETIRLTKKSDALIVFLILQNHLMITATKNSKLQVCNVYPYRSVSDMVYYIQSVREVTGLTQSTVPVFGLGEMKSREEDQEGGLWNMIPGLSFPHPSFPILSGEPVPWWKFSFLVEPNHKR